MSAESIPVTFHLVRGPIQILRQFTVAVPLDGTAVTVGRSNECQGVVDPLCIFTSQVQCSLFALKSTSDATSVEDEKEKNGNNNNNKEEGAQQPPSTPDRRTQAQKEKVEVYLSDMCSSNGTFINGVRIGGTEPHLLHNGDRCILGGMRDVEVGEALPADAFAGPELVVWQIELPDGTSAPPCELEETPIVLPLQEVVEREEKEVWQTVLRSLKKVEEEEEDGRRKGSSVMDTPRQKLFDGEALSPAGPPTSTKAPPASRKDEEEGAESPEARRALHREEPPTAVSPQQHTPVPRRSATIATLMTPRTPLVEAPTPTTAPLIATRVGRYTFHVPEEKQLHYLNSMMDTDEEEVETTKKTKKGAPKKKAGKRKGAAKRSSPCHKKLKAHDGEAEVVSSSSATDVAPYRLQFTRTHWQWTMDAPSSSSDSSSSSEPRHYMLPTTSILSVMACAARRGLAVELRDGCTLPLLDPSLLQGGEENRWLVWLVEDTDCAAVEKKEKENSGVADGKDGGEAEEATTFFSRLLREIEVFYSQSKFSPPFSVDEETFDRVFAPHIEKA